MSNVCYSPLGRLLDWSIRHTAKWTRPLLMSEEPDFKTACNRSHSHLVACLGTFKSTTYNRRKKISLADIPWISPVTSSVRFFNVTKKPFISHTDKRNKNKLTRIIQDSLWNPVMTSHVPLGRVDHSCESRDGGPEHGSIFSLLTPRQHNKQNNNNNKIITP